MPSSPSFHAFPIPEPRGSYSGISRAVEDIHDGFVSGTSHLLYIYHEHFPFPSNIYQQMNLAINISETIINLHRPYYAKALYEDLDDPVKSEFAPSYLTVIERCTVRLLSFPGLALIAHFDRSS